MTILDPAPAPSAVEDTASPTSSASPTAVQMRAFVRSGGRPAAHDHGVRCYWDFRDCRWVCTAG